MIRKATANWAGNATEGTGALTTQSHVLNAQPYGFKLRFENADGTAGTNPEELLAAAHAGCFTMAFAFALQAAGFVAQSLQTEALVTIVPENGGFTITSIHLALEASIPAIDQAQFDTLATAAKQTCPLSKALASVTITLDARLI